MERGRTELLRSLGFDKPAVTKDDGLLVVASAQIDYKRSARLDDWLAVTASFSKIARSHVVLAQKIFRGDELLCTGAIKLACVQKDSLRPVPMPKDLYSAISHWQQD